MSWEIMQVTDTDTFDGVPRGALNPVASTRTLCSRQLTSASDSAAAATDCALVRAACGDRSRDAALAACEAAAPTACWANASRARKMTSATRRIVAGRMIADSRATACPLSPRLTSTVHPFCSETLTTWTSAIRKSVESLSSRGITPDSPIPAHSTSHSDVAVTWYSPSCWYW